MLLKALDSVELGVNGVVWRVEALEYLIFGVAFLLWWLLEGLEERSVLLLLFLLLDLPDWFLYFMDFLVGDWGYCLDVLFEDENLILPVPYFFLHVLCIDRVEFWEAVIVYWIFGVGISVYILSVSTVDVDLSYKRGQCFTLMEGFIELDEKVVVGWEQKIILSFTWRF